MEVLILMLLLQVSNDVATAILNGLDKKRYNRVTKQLNDINSEMNKYSISANKAATKLGYLSEIKSLLPNASTAYGKVAQEESRKKAEYDALMDKQSKLVNDIKDKSNELSEINPNQSIGERIGNAWSKLSEKPIIPEMFKKETM